MFFIFLIVPFTEFVYLKFSFF